MLKVLLLPLRFAVGWGRSPRLLGWIGISMLVLLRVTIGWHFFSEGVDKYKAGNWSGAPFFANARGPFAEHFRQAVWDYDGSIRLDKDRMTRVWATYRDRVGTHFGFDEEQQRQAKENWQAALKQYDWVISQNAADLEEFEGGRDRLAKQDAEVDRDGVATLSDQRETNRREWVSKGAPALRQINQVWDNYEQVQNDLATDDQMLRRGWYGKQIPRDQPIDTSVMDGIVPYFDMAIGICLLVGLFTSGASLAAALFLGSVFLSQYPPATGPGSTNYQLIESMACLVLAGTGAGRFAGVDFFLHLITRKVWGSPNNQE
ncbi:MAG: DoxX family protein [Planctomycetota bacterium]